MTEKELHPVYLYKLSSNVHNNCIIRLSLFLELYIVLLHNNYDFLILICGNPLKKAVPVLMS
jgi:hypothetical protein